MTAGWLNDIDYKNITSGIASTSQTAADAKVEITSTGFSVSGAFDTLTIFNANGQKVLETSHASTPCSFCPGCCLVQLKKRGKVSTMKLMVFF